MTHLRTPFCALLLAAAAAAQTSEVLPLSRHATTWGGNNGTGTLFGGTKGISQNLYIAPFATDQKVVSVGFRRTAGTTAYAALQLDFEVLLSSTTANLSTLSATFASNLGTDATVVVPRGIINVPARGPNSSPADWVDLPANAPWVFNGPNLIVQAKAFASTWTSTGYRCDRVFERTTAGESIAYGTGCGPATATTTSTAPSYMAGSTITFSLASAPASQPAFLMLGADLTQWLAIPLPFDLTPLGMNGCWLLTSPDLTFGGITSGTGAASVQLPIPGGFSNVAVGAQWLYSNPNSGAPSQLQTSQARQVTVGPILAPNRYVYDLFSETVATGTLQAGGPVARLRTTN
jgi:hypothetical protein